MAETVCDPSRRGQVLERGGIGHQCHRNRPRGPDGIDQGPSKVVMAEDLGAGTRPARSAVGGSEPERARPAPTAAAGWWQRGRRTRDRWWAAPRMCPNPRSRGGRVGEADLDRVHVRGASRRTTQVRRPVAGPGRRRVAADGDGDVGDPLGVGRERRQRDGRGLCRYCARGPGRPVSRRTPSGSATGSYTVKGERQIRARGAALDAQFHGEVHIGRLGPHPRRLAHQGDVVGAAVRRGGTEGRPRPPVPATMPARIVTAKTAAASTRGDRANVARCRRAGAGAGVCGRTCRGRAGTTVCGGDARLGPVHLGVQA